MASSTTLYLALYLPPIGDCSEVARGVRESLPVGGWRHLYEEEYLPEAAFDESRGVAVAQRLYEVDTIPLTQRVVRNQISTPTVAADSHV